ncbi:S-adenosyl-L-methionine-dependent methyltransferase [Cladorrhinum sp. PSN259]|nr:S-adenosyl-L-methionine-dependent methyltransferase [Cladorrhinum sp. PSN259]
MALAKTETRHSWKEVILPANGIRTSRCDKITLTGIEEKPSHIKPPVTASDGNENRLLQFALEITTNLNKLSLGNNDAARIKTATSALELAARVRPPQDTIMGLFASMSTVSAIRVFSHWKAFDLIPPEGGISYSDLSQKLEAEEGLIRRITSMLTSSHILRHFSANSVGHTPTSLLLRSAEPMAAMFGLMYTNIIEVSTILPSYFDTYGTKEPLGPSHVPTSFLAGQPELGYFEMLSKDEARMKGFMHAMSVTSHRRVPVTGMYDMNQLFRRMETEDLEERVVWVDVGGGEGHILKRFREEFPQLRKGRCVVVDLQGVVEEGKRKAGEEEERRKSSNPELLWHNVEFVAGDFMTEIPVRGAMVYYLRHILRDYSDPVATVILKTIARAMTPGISRVLISEQLNPPAEAAGPLPLYAAFKDYSMLSIAGKERSLEQFEKIAEEAGLKVEGVFRDKATPQAVVELVLKGE